MYHLDLTSYKTVPAFILEAGHSSLKLRLEPKSPLCVTIFVFSKNVPVAYWNSDDYISGGEVNISNFDIGEEFSVLVCSHKDGFSNNLLGRKYEGAYLSRVNPASIISSGGRFSQTDVIDGTSYIINVPFNNYDYVIEYNPIGASMTEIGEVRL